MNKKMNLTEMMEIVNSQRLGQKRREEEFIRLTREMITYYYNFIDCNNKKNYLEASMNWILKNIMSFPEKEDYFKWVIQISTVCCLCNTDNSFLKTSIPEGYKKGISYPYLSVDEDTDTFIQKEFTSMEAIKLAREVFKEKELDLRILAGFFFLGGLSITEIAEYSEAKITDIAAGVQYIKNKLIDIVNKDQKSPDGEYVSLAEDNKILSGFKEGFFYAFNAKYEEKEELKEEVKESTNLRAQMLESLKQVSEGAAKESIKEAVKEPIENIEVLDEDILKEEKTGNENEQAVVTNEEEDYYDAIKKQAMAEAPVNDIRIEEPKRKNKLIEQIPKLTIDIKKEKEKEKEQKKPDVAKYYTLMGIGIAMAVVLLISFTLKLVRSFNNKEKEDNIVQEELVEDVTGQESDDYEDKEVERLIDAYNNQVGTVTIVLSGTTSEAPSEISDNDAYYFYGSNYEFNLQYSFANEYEENGIIDLAEVALEYTDRTEHFSKERYEEQKESLYDLNVDEYSFDDSKQTITRFTDWKETDMHTAYDYEKEDCITTWLSVLDSNKTAIEVMGDGCDLLPVMPENLTTTINGETYELVFSSASGYFIKDDVELATEGKSTNYTIVCDAYLETF